MDLGLAACISPHAYTLRRVNVPTTVRINAAVLGSKVEVKVMPSLEIIIMAIPFFVVVVIYRLYTVRRRLEDSDRAGHSLQLLLIEELRIASLGKLALRGIIVSMTFTIILLVMGYIYDFDLEVFDVLASFLAPLSVFGVALFTLLTLRLFFRSHEGTNL